MHLRQLDTEKSERYTLPERKMEQEDVFQQDISVQKTVRAATYKKEKRETIAHVAGIATSIMAVYIARMFLWMPLMRLLHDMGSTPFAISTVSWTLYIAMIVGIGYGVAQFTRQQARKVGVVLGNVLFYAALNIVLYFQEPSSRVPHIDYPLPHWAQYSLVLLTLIVTQVAVAEFFARRWKDKESDESCDTYFVSSTSLIEANR